MCVYHEQLWNRPHPMISTILREAILEFSYRVGPASSISDSPTDHYGTGGRDSHL